MCILTRLEGDNKDGVRTTVVRNIELLIVTAGTNWESSRIVYVQFAGVLYVDMNFPRGFS